MFQQLQNAQCKVVGEKIGDRSCTWQQLVDPFELGKGGTILPILNLLIGLKGELNMIQVDSNALSG